MRREGEKTKWQLMRTLRHQPRDRTTHKQHSEQPRHFIEEQKTRQQLVILSLQTNLHLTRKSLYSPMSERKHDE